MAASNDTSAKATQQQDGTASSSSSSSFCVKVMTFNIQQLYDMGPKTWWDQGGRAKRIPDALRSFCQHDNNKSNCPDVLILNEAFNSYAASIALQLKDIFPYQTPVIGKSKDGWKSTSGTFRTGYTVINGGAMILSKHPILEQRQYIYKANHAKTWDCWSNKGICHAKINIQGKYLVHVLGTHLQADEGHVPLKETHKVRMTQLQEVRHYLENELKLPKSERVILGGDLNVEYTTESFRKDMEETLAITKIHYNHSLPGSFSAPHNWMTKANARANGQSETRNETLDYILVPSDYVQPTKPAVMEVIPLKAKESWYWSYLAKQWPDEKGMTSDLSDHYPVVAVFEYQTTAV